MTDTIESHIGPEAACPNWLLKSAINNLSLGLLIFDGKYEVVYCNNRYMEIYGLSPGQVPDSHPVWWWMVLALIAALVGYLLMG